MPMILITYDDGENVATVTWTREYGFIASGDKQLLARITFEERAMRTDEIVQVPVLDVPMRRDVPRLNVETTMSECLVCEHPAHGRTPCTVYLAAANSECSCYGA